MHASPELSAGPRGPHLFHVHSQDEIGKCPVPTALPLMFCTLLCSLRLGVCSLSKPSEVRNSRWRLGSVPLANRGSGRLRRGYLSQPPMLAFSSSASCNHTFEANTGSLKALPTVAWIAHFSQCPLKRGLALGRIKPPSAAVEMKAGKKQLP